MNRAELIERVSEKANRTKTDVGRVIDAIAEVITESLGEGESVAWSRLGTWVVKERAARQVRNPMTKDLMMVEASQYPAFKPAKALKDALKGVKKEEEVVA